MIQANELRIGNWVSFENVFYKIHSLAEVFPTLDTEEFGIGVVDYNNIHPIPLTEEILLKCGFVKVRYEKYSHNKLDKLRAYPHVNKEGFGIYIMGSYTLPNIKHLHQLQNLYFALTGKELEFSLT